MSGLEQINDALITKLTNKCSEQFIEIADLRDKLEVANTEKEQWKQSFMSVKRYSADTVDEIIKKRDNLQAANGVLRGALELIKNGGTKNYPWNNGETMTLEAEIASKALSTTPAEAGERVRELVDALEKLARLGNGDRYGNSDGNVIAEDALAKYRGCGK